MRNAACTHSYTSAYTYATHTHACKHTYRVKVAGIAVGGTVLVIAVGGVIIVMGYIYTRQFTHSKRVSH